MRRKRPNAGLQTFGQTRGVARMSNRRNRLRHSAVFCKECLMQRFQTLLIVAISAMAWQNAHAQLTQQEHQRALDVLRKRLADEQRATTPRTTTPMPRQQPMPSVQQPVTVQPMRRPAPAPAMSGSHQEMMKILHQTLGQQETVTTPRPRRIPRRTPETAETPAPAPTPAPTVQQTTPTPLPVPTPEPAPTTPAAPQTKAERLAELNALYFADKITPAEYHERRAKIIAEP